MEVLRGMIEVKNSKTLHAKMLDKEDDVRCEDVVILCPLFG
jgi:hypothetical protein